mmetsp:Transcript_33462/g.72412  ORF Transcript_33462/g.72412 Transcript_33462/m.72412 type:complete len:381 (+) Transcript_33462:446-1588(+)
MPREDSSPLPAIRINRFRMQYHHHLIIQQRRRRQWVPRQPLNGRTRSVPSRRSPLAIRGMEVQAAVVVVVGTAPMRPLVALPRRRSHRRLPNNSIIISNLISSNRSTRTYPSITPRGDQILNPTRSGPRPLPRTDCSPVPFPHWSGRLRVAVVPPPETLPPPMQLRGTLPSRMMFTTTSARIPKIGIVRRHRSQQLRRKQQPAIMTVHHPCTLTISTRDTTQTTAIAVTIRMAGSGPSGTIATTGSVGRATPVFTIRTIQSFRARSNSSGPSSWAFSLACLRLFGRSSSNPASRLFGSTYRRCCWSGVCLPTSMGASPFRIICGSARLCLVGYLRLSTSIYRNRFQTRTNGLKSCTALEFSSMIPSSASSLQRRAAWRQA